MDSLHSTLHQHCTAIDVPLPPRVAARAHPQCCQPSDARSRDRAAPACRVLDGDAAALCAGCDGGGEEEKVGFKSFDDLDEILDYLEIEEEF